MQPAVKEFAAAFSKPAIPQVKSGDTVRVQQLIREGGKQRVQAFSGTVIRVRAMASPNASITVRWMASGVGVEKTILLHSPLIKKVDIIKRGKVRRNYLTYLRGRSGRSARLVDQIFDREAVNIKEEEPEVAAQKAEDEKDAEITELPTENSIQPDENLEPEVSEESKEAESDEAKADVSEENDEQELPAEEVQEKLDKADDEDTNAQKPNDSI